MEFRELIPDDRLLAAIAAMGFGKPTEIQEKAIPPALQGQDLIGQAKTGSGKTLAFGIPLMKRLRPERRVQALILVPTRELCQQVGAELQRLARSVPLAMVFGGVAINPQVSSLRSAQVVVATPGRLLDHMERGTFRGEGIHFLVFDEADRMFDMGFLKDMEAILQRLPRERQTLLFSATMPEAIKRLASRHQRNPVHIRAKELVESHLLPQFFYRTHEKFSLLVHLIKKENPGLALVFCRTKHGSKALARNLQKQGIEAEAMHGNLSQAQRDKVMASFKSGKTQVMVATDIVQRGIDIKLVTHVFNYNVPHVPEDYVHRIGRTARAGESGKAITLVERAEEGQWRAILRLPNIFPQERWEQFPVLEYQGRARQGPAPSQRGFRSRDRPPSYSRLDRPQRAAQRGRSGNRRPQFRR
ncbi:DEAD/DEAH box helicase [Candidatus Woesearchaeota archaeon]|nr:DEAD/DEAH box helicase [Candidatus Woesearchaeota archaeon]